MVRRLLSPLLPILALAAALAVAAACTDGGSGPLPGPTGAKEPTTGGEEPGGGGVEPGTTGVEPGGSSPEPGNGVNDPQGGGSGGGQGGACLPCVVYDCDLTATTTQGTLTSQVTVSLASGANGSCLLEDEQVAIECGGVLTSTSSGTNIGTWYSSGGGGFSATTGTVTLTCTPSPDAG